MALESGWRKKHLFVGERGVNNTSSLTVDCRLGFAEAGLAVVYNLSFKYVIRHEGWEGQNGGGLLAERVGIDMEECSVRHTHTHSHAQQSPPTARLTKTTP